jgi:Fe-S cluster assembly protein SufD
VFKGRIRLPSQAQHSDAGQLCRSVMLGARARLQAMPVLEIMADKVACSHGATVADLDANSMFYLASRGVDRLQARKMLLKGFVFDPLQGFLLVSHTSADTAAWWVTDGAAVRCCCAGRRRPTAADKQAGSPLCQC